MHDATRGNDRSISSYKPWCLPLADHLGGSCSFYDITALTPRISLNLKDILQRRCATMSHPAPLDATAFVVKALSPHLPGDRTLITGDNCAPRMGWSQFDGRWALQSPPPHGTERPDLDQFFVKWEAAPLTAVERPVHGRSVIGLLLSGGVDHRVVAGINRQRDERAGLTQGLRCAVAHPEPAQAGVQVFD